ncbi:OLC1v1034616C2 [Oldenlandia corymbosa var. corymbosa]|uniref:OLC1v1034616C2 n=1 Tax=Oldenlandia corymbosa var. corymbosa TaxID=529605 RepID=A0AAV1CRQ0_OLDCO|nr:OLC1v1034616C2 [Oldenlandia corymbosa var. corymbosa]
MANSEESNPLLPKQESAVEATLKNDAQKVSTDKNQALDAGKQSVDPSPMDWTAEGLPLAHGSVVGEPIMGRRTPWNSSLCACLGQNDDFCSSDLEVCLLGSVAPCVLYGSNVERLGSSPGSFANHCLSYTGLYLIGNSFFGWNCLAPWFSYNSRTAIRRRFNLEVCHNFVHLSSVIHKVVVDPYNFVCMFSKLEEIEKAVLS